MTTTPKNEGQTKRPVTCSAVDYHTAGEPFRIVTLPWALPGDTVVARRMSALDDDDTQLLRRSLCHEPRGHADMYGGFIVPPDDADAHFGVLFWHKDGFSTACGHGTIALGAWAVQNKLVDSDPDGVTEVVIDVPSGRVRALVRSVGGEVQDIDFVSVPSHTKALDIRVETSQGAVNCDLGFGGAIYAHVNAADLGLEVVPENLNRFIELGREIQGVLNESAHTLHNEDDSMREIYGTIFYEDHGKVASTLTQRNVTIFADGQVDRSPCGSGTASRVAVLHSRGLLTEGDQLEHQSIIGSHFSAVFTRSSATGDTVEVVPTITGTARITGRHEFVFDPQDDLVSGFVLR